MLARHSLVTPPSVHPALGIGMPVIVLQVEDCFAMQRMHILMCQYSLTAATTLGCDPGQGCAPGLAGLRSVHHWLLHWPQSWRVCTFLIPLF